MSIPDRVTTIRFPRDYEFAAFRAFVQQHYAASEAVVERHQVRSDGSTLATLATTGFSRPDHDFLVHTAFRAHGGVVV